MGKECSYVSFFTHVKGEKFLVRVEKAPTMNPVAWAVFYNDILLGSGEEADRMAAKTAYNAAIAAHFAL